MAAEVLTNYNLMRFTEQWKLSFVNHLLIRGFDDISEDTDDLVVFTQFVSDNKVLIHIVDVERESRNPDVADLWDRSAGC